VSFFVILELVLSLVAILGAAILFTNGVEILGERLNLGGGAVGSILAAAGTALPETMIPLVAIIGGLITGESGTSEISAGAIIGAPFLLATLGMGLVGASALVFRQRRESGAEIAINEEVTRRDVGYFLPFFAAAGVLGFVPAPSFVKVAAAVALVGAYAYFVRQTLKYGGEGQEDTPDLLLWPSSSGSPPTWAVFAQVIVPIGIMAGGAHYFVQAVESISQAIGVPAGLIALILAPLATELPEKFNSVHWMRENKDTLAVGNISGAMVFQSTLPVALGLAFTPWNLDFLTGLAIALALVSGTVLFAMLINSQKPLRGQYLLGGGVLYAAFVVVAILAVVSF
jgi:cation:H+ antiporter